MALLNVRNAVQKAIYKIINPLVHGLIKLGITPNFITATGLFINIIATAILIYGATYSERGNFKYVGLAGIIIFWAKINMPVIIPTVIGSWTPTIVLFVLFKKLLPNDSIKSFYKSIFKQRLNWKILSYITIIQIIIFIWSIFIVSYMNKISLNNLLDFSVQAILTGFLISLITGATGEESGWRGFLQTFMEKKHSVIKTSLIIGVIWGFWHTPLWFLDGLTGIQLVHYILAFMTWVISASVIIGICYNLCKNLIIPIWIHFLMNFLLVIVNKNIVTNDLLTIFTSVAIFYAFAAIIYIIWYKKYKLKSIDIRPHIA